MSRPEKKGIVPALRFPEFRDKEAWEKNQLGRISTIVRGGSPRPIEAYITRDINALNWLKIGDVDKESKYVTHTEEQVKKSALSKTRVVNPGDLIMSNSMSFGRPYILKIKSCIHDGWIAVTEISNSIDRDYLYYLILSNESQVYFSNAAAGGGVKNLNADIIKALPVASPKKPEQQKIADCLTSVDELITAHTKKLDALKTHKKGLMQQLFPAEGEAVPKLRFPEFQDKGGWKKNTIGECGEVVTGSTPSTMRSEFYGGNIPFVSPADISDLRFVDKTKTTLTTLGFNETRPIKANSVLFVCIGSTIGKVAQNTRECATNQQINSVIPNDKHSSGFLYYLLSLNDGRIANLAGKQAVPIINKTLFSSVTLYVPKLPEQERIAACLTTIDGLITVQTQKVESLRSHKKGLMQQLFPAMNEVKA